MPERARRARARAERVLSDACVAASAAALVVMEIWLLLVVTCVPTCVLILCLARCCCWWSGVDAPDDGKLGESSAASVSIRGRTQSWALQPARTLSWLLANVGGPPAPRPVTTAAKERVAKKREQVTWLKGSQRRASEPPAAGSSTTLSSSDSFTTVTKQDRTQSATVTKQDRTQSGPIRGVRDHSDSRIAQLKWLSSLEEALQSMRSFSLRKSRRSDASRRSNASRRSAGDSCRSTSERSEGGCCQSTSQHAEDEASTVPAAAPATTLDGAKVDVPANAVAVGDAV